MIFLEIAGAAVLVVVFAIGAWHVWKYLTKEKTND